MLLKFIFDRISVKNYKEITNFPIIVLLCINKIIYYY